MRKKARETCGLRRVTRMMGELTAGCEKGAKIFTGRDSQTQLSKFAICADDHRN